MGGCCSGPSSSLQDRRQRELDLLVAWKSGIARLSDEERGANLHKERQQCKGVAFGVWRSVGTFHDNFDCLFRCSPADTDWMVLVAPCGSALCVAALMSGPEADKRCAQKTAVTLANEHTRRNYDEKNLILKLPGVLRSALQSMRMYNADLLSIIDNKGHGHSDDWAKMIRHCQPCNDRHAAEQEAARDAMSSGVHANMRASRKARASPSAVDHRTIQPILPARLDDLNPNGHHHPHSGLSPPQPHGQLSSSRRPSQQGRSPHQLALPLAQRAGGSRHGSRAGSREVSRSGGNGHHHSPMHSPQGSRAGSRAGSRNGSPSRSISRRPHGVHPHLPLVGGVGFGSMIELPRSHQPRPSVSGRGGGGGDGGGGVAATLQIHIGVESASGAPSTRVGHSSGRLTNRLVWHDDVFYVTGGGCPELELLDLSACIESDQSGHPCLHIENRSPYQIKFSAANVGANLTLQSQCEQLFKLNGKSAGRNNDAATVDLYLTYATEHQMT